MSPIRYAPKRRIRPVCTTLGRIGLVARSRGRCRIGRLGPVQRTRGELAPAARRFTGGPPSPRLLLPPRDANVDDGYREVIMTIHDATGLTTDQRATTPDADGGPRNSVADVLEPTFEALLDGRPPVSFEFWDGSVLTNGTRRSAAHRARDIARRVRGGSYGPPANSGLLGPIVCRRARHRPATWPRRCGGAADVDALDVKVAAAALPAVISAARSGLGIDRHSPTSHPAEEVFPRGVRHSMRRDSRRSVITMTSATTSIGSCWGPR